MGCRVANPKVQSKLRPPNATANAAAVPEERFGRLKRLPVKLVCEDLGSFTLACPSVRVVCALSAFALSIQQIAACI